MVYCEVSRKASRGRPRGSIQITSRSSRRASSARTQPPSAVTDSPLNRRRGRRGCSASQSRISSIRSRSKPTCVGTTGSGWARLPVPFPSAVPLAARGADGGEYRGFHARPGWPGQSLSVFRRTATTRATRAEGSAPRFRWARCRDRRHPPRPRGPGAS